MIYALDTLERKWIKIQLVDSTFEDIGHAETVVVVESIRQFKQEGDFIRDLSSGRLYRIIKDMEQKDAK